MQDKYGFMWLGTDDGLNRYDGTTIKIYRLNPEGVNDYISFYTILQIGFG